MSAARFERSLRELVEGAGFVLAMSLDQAGLFRILAPDGGASVVGSAAVSAGGFRVVFPGLKVQVSMASDLVDALERIKAAL